MASRSITAARAFAALEPVLKSKPQGFDYFQKLFVRRSDHPEFGE